MKFFLIVFFWVFFIFYFVLNESLVGFLMTNFEFSLTNLFFLNSSEVEGSYIFYRVYLMVFFTVILGSLPFCVNELLRVLFYIALAIWLNGFIGNLLAVVYAEEGGTLSVFIYVLAVVRTIVQPITLSLRITVNLVLGEALMRFFVFYKSNSLFLRRLYEGFVIFLQRRVFFYLLCSYNKR